jgi:hypothetical protein
MMTAHSKKTIASALIAGGDVTVKISLNGGNLISILNGQ